MTRIPPGPGSKKPATPASPRVPATRRPDLPEPARRAGGLPDVTGGPTRPNPYVTAQRGPTSVEPASPGSVSLSAPREMARAYRDGILAGAGSWMVSALPVETVEILGPRFVARSASLVVEEFPRVVIETFSTVGGVTRTVRTVFSVVRVVGSKLAETALEGGEAADRLKELGSRHLEKAEGQTRQVLERLLGNGGRGLGDFAHHLVRGVRTGFQELAGRMADNLKDGLAGWLRDALPEGLELPRRFDAKELLGFAKDVLRLAGRRLFEQLASRVPEEAKVEIGPVAGRLEELRERGPEELAREVATALGRVARRALGAGDRAAEWAGEAAATVEETLEKTVPAAVDLLAGTLGLGAPDRSAAEAQGAAEEATGRASSVAAALLSALGDGG